MESACGGGGRGVVVCVCDYFNCVISERASEVTPHWEVGQKFCIVAHSLVLYCHIPGSAWKILRTLLFNCRLGDFMITRHGCARFGNGGWTKFLYCGA